MSSFKEQAEKLVNNGFSIVPIAKGSKRPIGKEWTTKEFTPSDIVAGVGVKCGIGDFPICAIDIDVLDESIAKKVVDYCHDKIGYTVERVGQAPKILLPYRAGEPNWKKISSRKFGEQNYQIEVLGMGQQFVAYAIHPKTNKPYEYTDVLGGLEDVKASELPVITLEQVADVIAYFEQLCIDAGLPTSEQASLNKTNSNTHTSKDSVADFDDFTKDQPIGIALAEIKHYLSFVADGDSYDKWLDVGMMLHHEFNGDIAGLELWDEWASQFNKYDGYDSIAEKWQTFDGMQKAKPITLRTLIKWAKENPSFKPYQISPNDIEQARAVIAELATLDTLEYALQSKAKAKLLNITLPMLDKAVKEAKAESDLDQMAKIIDDIEPYSEPVDGNRLAGEIYQLVNSHIACDEAIAVTVTLWIFFTWCVDVSYIAPIAWINAPEKRCGKTQLATLMGRMSMNAISTTNITPAALFRCIDRYAPSLIIDEADSFMKDNEDLRGIINAGFSRDNCYLWRCVGDSLEPTPFNVYGAKVISGIGKLPSTIMDRAISLTLRRAMKHEKKQRIRVLPKEVTDTIKAKLSRWTSDNKNDIATIKPQLPESIYNREFDTWEILFQIADTLGNDWLERITVACLTITGNEPAEPSLNEQLLTDIKAIFESRKTDRLATHDLLDSLTFDMGDGEAMRWANFYNGKAMTARQLASRLKEFKISNKPLRVNGEVKKGYDINDFKDAFNRYLS